MHVRAIEYIPPNHEVCISYHPLGMPLFWIREEELRASELDIYPLEMQNVRSRSNSPFAV
jgi:hypothetical protein